MGTSIEPKSGKPVPSAPSKKQEQFWLVGELGILAVALGAEVSPERLGIYARDLTVDLTREQLEHALTKARRECRFFPMISELREWAGADLNAEKRAAWDEVEWFVSTWLRWNCERTSAYIEKGAPQLSQRILDCVRRSGGWTTYLRMTDGDFPFVQKRFFEEYESWTEVESVITDPSRQLVTSLPKQLPTGVKTETRSESITTPVEILQRMKPKSIPEPLTDAQIRDRRACLRQQLDQIQRKRA